MENTLDAPFDEPSASEAPEAPEPEGASEDALASQPVLETPAVEAAPVSEVAGGEGHAPAQSTEGPAAGGEAVVRTHAQPVALRTITVKSSRISCELSVPDELCRYTTPKLAAFACGQYPDLPHHACVNDFGPSFGAVIESTSTPHLLEHLVISLQTRAAKGSSTRFVGTTEWLDEAAGLARVEVSFRDDLEALSAFKEASDFLNLAIATCLG